MADRVERNVFFTVISIPILIAYSIILTIVVFRLLWGWFVTEIFSLPALTYLQATGLVLLIRSVTGSYNLVKEKRVDKEALRQTMDEIKRELESGANPNLLYRFMNRNFTEPIVLSFITITMLPFLMLVFGFLVHLLMK